MKKCYLGVDIGSISTKGVVIDESNNIIASEYLWTEGNPVGAVKRLVSILKNQVESDYVLKGIGTTGSARKLIGLMLGTNAVKNEITAHAVGTTSLYPDVRTILEIGGIKWSGEVVVTIIAPISLSLKMPSFNIF